MTKKVLILSSSPRRKGNSDSLCDEFMQGAIDAGHQVEKIFLRDKVIHPCIGCDVCSSQKKPCPQNDDPARKMMMQQKSSGKCWKQKSSSWELRFISIP